MVPSRQMNMRSLFVAALGLLLISVSIHVMEREVHPSAGLAVAVSEGGAHVFDTVLPKVERDQRLRAGIGSSGDGDEVEPKVRLFHIGLPFPLPVSLVLPVPPPLLAMSVCAETFSSSPRAPPVLS